MRGGRAAEVVALLILAFGVWLGFASAGLPDIVPATAPARVFSAQRAMRDLQLISDQPHATGTAAHDRVRDYLVDRLRALGCDDVHIQSATGFNTLDGPIAATVANIVARKRGAHAGPAVLLMAHYDAVPRGPGAGDDGAAIAAILETLRALANSPPLDHDLLIVFSDAEEDGLLGAEAFVDLHPWARDVGVVLNFEGRGDAGPVFMFQTSPGNAGLIGALASSVPGARTNSLTGEVYRHLPSDTDLSVWLHSAFTVGALNFAHVGGYTRYHTPIDNVASLDERVVQQMGDYAVPLVHTLTHDGSLALRTTDATYFNAPLVGVLHYPAAWALPLGLMTLVGVLVLIGVAVRRRQLSAGGAARGALLLLLTLVIPTALAFLAWRLIQRLHPAYAEILQGDPYNSLWYLLAISALAVAIVIELQRRFATQATALELLIAPMLLWSGFVVASAVLLPGASYLLLWPLLAVVIGAAWWLTDMRTNRPSHLAIALLALPALVLWPPVIRSLEIALTAHLLPFCALLIALLLAVLPIQIELAGWFRRWIVVGACLLAATALVVAEATAGFNATRRRPDSLAYLVDTDASRAWWITFDRISDAWNRAALGAHPVRRSFADARLTAPGDSLLSTEVAPGLPTPSPVSVLTNEPAGDHRRIHLHVDRSGDGEILSLYLNGPGTVGDLTINGRILANGDQDRYLPQYHQGRDGSILRYFGVPEGGVDLWFTLRTTGKASLRVVTAVEGLPPLAPGPIPPRPAAFMSKPFVPTDMTIVQRTVRL